MDARTFSARLSEYAIDQQGPWAGQRLRLTPAWLHHALEEAILAIDWPHAISDVQRFLPIKEQAGLRQWKADLFLYQARRMAESMRADPGMPGS